MTVLPPPVEHDGYLETPSMILPPAIPAEVSTAVDAAGRRSDALASSGRELHFVVEPGGGLSVQLRDHDAAVLRTLTPTQAISLMAGLGQL